MLESIVSDVADQYGNDFQINAVLDDAVKDAPTPAVEAFLFWRFADEPTAEPQPLGTATIGSSIEFPIDIPDGRDIEIFAVAKTATGEQSAVNPLDGLTQQFSPNRETGTANFSQSGTAANLRIDFLATGYSVAKFRKIQYATNSGFTTGLVEKIEGNVLSPLPSAFFISRDSGASALAVYVRIAHSTNNQAFGDWSETRTATFADSGGSGGTGAGDPPMDLSYSLRGGGVVDLYWTDGAGTNTVYRNGSSLGTASNSYSDNLTDAGYYTYEVANADGATDPVSFYWSGFEI